jgi:hypothetical protein
LGRRQKERQQHQRRPGTADTIRDAGHLSRSLTKRNTPASRRRHACQKLQHRGAEFASPLCSHVRPSEDFVIAEGDKLGARKAVQSTAHRLCDSPPIARDREQLRGEVLDRLRVEPANYGQRGKHLGMFGCEPGPIARQSADKMGLINAQVVEKLPETFLDGQHRFCSHILPLSARTMVYSGTIVRFLGICGNEILPRRVPRAAESDGLPTPGGWEGYVRPYLACVAQLDRCRLTRRVHSLGRIPLWVTTGRLSAGVQ